MNGFDRRQKQSSHNHQGHRCHSKNDSNRYDDEFFEQMEKEAEEELELAKETLRTTENGMRQNQNFNDMNGRRPVNRNCVTVNMPCKPNNISGKDAIKILSKVPGKDFDSRCKFKSREPPMQKVPCTPVSDEAGNKLPKRPDLTLEEIGKLIDQETKDVESAWILTSEAKETYKKPCPKQQKARDAVRAIMEPKKDDFILPCMPLILKETLPLVDPDPDDISPEVAANMMYTQERGIRMISCPEDTIRHLFPDQFDEKSEGDDATDIEMTEGTEGADDSVFTRTMSQQKEAGGEDQQVQQEGNKQLGKKEFILQEKASKYANRVQLRGNFAPWFPGYYVCFPDQGGKGGVQLAKSPSGIFQKAWMAVKPENIPSSELYAVE